MKVALVAILVLIVSTATVLGAQEPKKEQFWRGLKGKTQKLTTRKKTTAPAVVAGIKGTKNEKADIYWKGKETRTEVDEDEMQKFNQAMECQEKGEKALALQHFETFIQEYPNSLLQSDCTEAIKLLKAELGQPSAAAAAPIPAPAAAAEPAASVSPAVPAPENSAK